MEEVTQDMHAVTIETNLDDPCCWTRRVVVEGLSEDEARTVADRLRQMPWDMPVSVAVVPVARLGARLPNGHVRYVEEEGNNA